MNPQKKERRKYDRYATEVEIYFRVTYDLKTKVEFQVVNKDEKQKLSKKYSANSKNVSAEALCFTCKHELRRGDFLLLEVYLPSEKKPINMQGEVIWSQTTSSQQKTRQTYDTGVRLITVNGVSVKESIHFDDSHQVTWSIVLESVFGNFRKLAQKRHTP